MWLCQDLPYTSPSSLTTSFSGIDVSPMPHYHRQQIPRKPLPHAAEAQKHQWWIIAVKGLCCWNGSSYYEEIYSIQRKKLNAIGVIWCWMMLAETIKKAHVWLTVAKPEEREHVCLSRGGHQSSINPHRVQHCPHWCHWTGMMEVGKDWIVKSLKAGVTEEKHTQLFNHLQNAKKYILMDFLCFFRTKSHLFYVRKEKLLFKMCVHYQVFLDECQMKSSSTTASTVGFTSLKKARISSHIGGQYNCWRKINWGSEYPVIVDLSKVSDGGVWLSVTGNSTWWSSVPMGRGNAISEGFTSVASSKGLFSFGREFWSLKELSSVMGSGGVSQPECTFALCFFRFLISV